MDIFVVDHCGLIVKRESLGGQGIFSELPCGFDIADMDIFVIDHRGLMAKR